MRAANRASVRDMPVGGEVVGEQIEMRLHFFRQALLSRASQHEVKEPRQECAAWSRFLEQAIDHGDGARPQSASAESCRLPAAVMV